MSITLPRNFSFHYSEDDLPKTPLPLPETQQIKFSAPRQSSAPRQMFKVKRRRPVADATTREMASDESQPLPTFEMTEAVKEEEEGEEEEDYTSQFGASVTNGYLAPRSQTMPFLSPPKTPVSQTDVFDAEDEQSEWSMIANRHYIARPLSACSSISGSSTSSFGSSNHSDDPSFGGSCTSPESEAADPFSYSAPKAINPIFSPDLAFSPSEASPSFKRSKTARHSKWTPEMDDHLWLTYMFYVQDPRVTPFKTLPGTAPPLGVCHRVAREAKNSWPRYRAANLLEESQHPRIQIDRAESPNTIRPDDMESNGSSTPIAPDQCKIPVKWSRSEGATRRRLRELCKRKPSLSAHYQRLLKTRSPSPFQSSSPRSSSDANVSAPSSRSLYTSLAAATTPAPAPAPAIESDAPPASLMTSDISVPAAPKGEVKLDRPAGWFQRIGRSSAHQKSRSLQLGLGIGSRYATQSDSHAVLASPFDGGSAAQDDVFGGMSTTQSLGRSFIRRPDNSGDALNSPVELHAPIPTFRSLKRRFNLDDESANATFTHNALENLFTNNSGTNFDTPARPARERAFSLGAVQDGTRSLNSFFRPSVPDIPMSDEGESGSEIPSSGFLQPPTTDAIPRLRSPFGGASAAAPPQFNTFPRRFTPLGSEIPHTSFTPNTSLEATFRQLANKGPEHR